MPPQFSERKKKESLRERTKNKLYVLGLHFLYSNNRLMFSLSLRYLPSLSPIFRFFILHFKSFVPSWRLLLNFCKYHSSFSRSILQLKGAH
ncbi:hypothetical protein IFM89_012739 [Coptis chinensis]|uniref:Uncharacterized protein n=1 Tax=Coptis chinensis TaxID=261450 RepID=A0A835HC89_9MAGN|nr:hypothetical protein IFM89_012739 [Coptis chinensis]